MPFTNYTLSVLCCCCAQIDEPSLINSVRRDSKLSSLYQERLKLTTLPFSSQLNLDLLLITGLDIKLDVSEMLPVVKQLLELAKPGGNEARNGPPANGEN